MRFDKYRFAWGNEGHVTIELYFKGRLLSSFTVDDIDCDNFIRDLTKSREDAKRAKRK